MNKKAQINMLGILLITFITVLVGLVLFTTVSQTVGQSTTLGNQNTSAGSDALVIGTPGVEQNLAGKFVDTATFLAINQTTGATIGAANYSIRNNVLVNGELTAVINASGTAAVESPNWNVSYTFQPVGFISDPGSRAVTSLIAIFMALAIMVVALVPTLRSGLMEMFGR
jgi:hypothetical protein